MHTTATDTATADLTAASTARIDRALEPDLIAPHLSTGAGTAQSPGAGGAPHPSQTRKR